MSSTKVEICNLALGHIGQRTIQSIDELSNEAVTCKRFYDRVRKIVLRSHPWRWALKTELLALNDESPPGWTYSYARPSDVIRILSIVPEGGEGDQTKPVEFEEFGQAIWTDDSQGMLKYIWNVVDPNTFDDLFVDSMSYLLASFIAMPITGKAEMKAGMVQMYANSMPHAQAVNANEARRKPIANTALKDSRV